MAASTALGWTVAQTHPAKVDAAVRLCVEQGLPDIYHLLISLNRARKAVAYGDSPLPQLNAEDVAAAVERYVDAAAGLVNRPP